MVVNEVHHLKKNNRLHKATQHTLRARFFYQRPKSLGKQINAHRPPKFHDSAAKCRVSAKEKKSRSTRCVVRAFIDIDTHLSKAPHNIAGEFLGIT